MRSLLNRITIVTALLLAVVGTTTGLRTLAQGRPSLRPEISRVPVASPTFSGATLSVTSISEPSPVRTTRTSFVDVRSGRATLLPRSIRAIPGATHFRLSPDGTMLAFDDGANVYVSAMDGKGIRTLTPDANDGFAVGPSWSPDGTRIVYGKGGAVYVVDVAASVPPQRAGWRGTDTERTHAVVSQLRHGVPTSRTHEVVSRARHGVWRPEFSPDGEHILFTSLTRRRVNPARLWTVPSDGGRARMLPLKGAAFGTFSPDGTSIAYRRTNFNGDITHMTSGAVWLADADGSDPHGRRAGWMSQIDPMALWPVWSPDGTRIVYERLYCQGVLVFNVLTRRVTKIGDGVDPSWADRDTLIVNDFGQEECR